MGPKVADPDKGPHPILRDAAWEREVRREVVRAVVERERRALPFSLLAWIALAIAAFTLPYASALVLPLTLRLASLAFSHWSTHRLRKALERGGTLRRHACLVIAALALAGVTWALLLYPYEPVQAGHPATSSIRGLVIVGVAMVAVTYGPMRWPMFALVGTFAATLCVSILFNLDRVAPGMTLTVLAVSAGMAGFAYAAARQQIAACEMLVDNRRLTDELAEAFAQAEFLSQHDPLTGLLNRRAFFEHDAPEPKIGTLRHILAIDLDHFKAINDTFGHEIGDRVLVATADEMRGVVRALPRNCHRAVRLGGEEFALLVEGVDRATAGGLAEALRRRIERIPQTIGNPAIRVTASIGLASCEPGETIDDALRRSDLAMYRAKDRGRNRVVGEAA